MLSSPRKGNTGVGKMSQATLLQEVVCELGCTDGQTRRGILPERENRKGKGQRAQHSDMAPTGVWWGWSMRLFVLASFHNDKTSGLLAVIVKYSRVFQDYC